MDLRGTELPENPGASPAVAWSVIVPTCDRPDMLAKCLHCLAAEAQGIAADRYEVIVADDGSEVRAVDALGARYPWVRWVSGPQRGPAANRNAGARAARGEWLAFTDDDCLPDRGWLGALMRVGANPDAVVLEGRTVAPGPREHVGQHAPINEEGGLLWSCNVAFRAALFGYMGGFDERFPHASMEDIELRYRLDLAGIRARFVPEARVVHPWRDVDELADERRYWESLAVYLRIHPEERRRLGRIGHLENAARKWKRDGATALVGGDWGQFWRSSRAFFRSLRDVAGREFPPRPKR